MLVIKDVVDLKKYLETRLKMATAQTKNSARSNNDIERGMIYAFGESIKAVDALIESEKLTEELERSKLS